MLEHLRPVATEEGAWANGTVPIRISAFAHPAALPDELIVSIRCIVRVDGRLVVCTNIDGNSHPWPGGRREPGESHADTACREVHEETGWILDAGTLRPLGWLHLEDLTPRDDNWVYPHPDFLQIVYTAEAIDRSGGRHAEWTDTEGYEASSTLMSPAEAREAVEGLARPFLDLLS